MKAKSLSSPARKRGTSATPSAKAPASRARAVRSTPPDIAEAIKTAKAAVRQRKAAPAVSAATSPTSAAAPLPPFGATQSRYGQTSYDSGATYAVGDTPTPEPSASMAKVKLELYLRTDSDLANWVGDHIELITGDPAFPSPLPLPADLAAALTLFLDCMASQTQALAAAKAATTAKDLARKALEDLMNIRGSYVQTESGGNPLLIENVGLAVKSNGTPVGPLMPPTDINITLTSVAGVMTMRWKRVYRARGYIVQCSPDVQPREWSQIKNTTKTTLTLENMEVGKTYVFRFATQGGSTGQSPWSAEVIRGAA